MSVGLFSLYRRSDITRPTAYTPNPAAIPHGTRVHGADLIGEMQYENTYRLAYIRGPEGIIIALAEQLG